MEILRTENLCKNYGKDDTLVKALDNVNLSVEKGDFIAVVGSSGSGKSTLLHVLGGVDTITSGRVLINNQDYFKLSDKEQTKFRRTNIGLIYQFYNLIPTLNVRENILLPLLLDNREKDEKYLNELLKMLNLESRVTHIPSELSGGQQQRVSIARALITRPSIILADEPTGNLDSKNSKDIMELLKKANHEYGQTIIMVTHDLDLARYANRVITLEDGHIIKDEVATYDNQ